MKDEVKEAKTASVPAAKPEAKAKPKPAEPTLETALCQARDALGAGLRALIAGGVPEGEQFRNKTEDVFEQLKNEIAAKNHQHATLALASKQLQAVTHALANNSKTRGDTLQALRTHASQIAKHVETFAPKLPSNG